MKKSIQILAFLFVTFASFGQTGFNYKALITENANALNNQAVTFRFSLLQNGTTAIYVETQSATTDSNGIASVNVGEGTVQSGDFSGIDWGSDSYFLKVEIDTGNGFQDFGTTELKYVPYAKYAETAGNTFSGNFNDLSGVPAGLSDGDDVNDADHNPTNELQTLSVNGTQLTISNGNSVTLPTGSGGDQWGSQVVQSNSSLNGNGTSASPLGVNTSSSVFNGWDKNASDDFSGDYNDLYNKPVTFYKSGTTTIPTSITQNMYHLGEIYIGRNDAVYPYSKLTVDGTIANNNANRAAIYTLTSDNGSGAHIGLYADMQGSGNGYQTGLYAMITNSGTGDHFGTYNWLSGSGTGEQTGTKNLIENNNDNAHFGVFNSLTGNGSGTHIAVYNRIEGDGSGLHAGTANLIDSDGDGIHYATYNDIYGSGSGDKYGSYNIIDQSSGGTHYGVYSDVHYTKGYAGYFKGRMYISHNLGIDTDNPTGRLQTIPSGNINDGGTINAGHAGLIVGTPTDGLLFDANQIERQGGTFYINFLSSNDVEIGRGGGNVIVYNKINSPTTGTADMKAYAYGTIDATGTIQNGSNNFTVNKTGTGVYVITFTGQNFSYSDFSVTANVMYNNSGLKFVKMYYENHKLVIETQVLNVSGGTTSINNQNNRFSFMVFKK